MDNEIKNIPELQHRASCSIFDPMGDCDCGQMKRITVYRTKAPLLEKITDLESQLTALRNELEEAKKQRDFEKGKRERMAEALKQQNQQLYDENLLLAITRFKHFNEDECWIWQGDGSDCLESLVCPVVIRASDLIEITKGKAPIEAEAIRKAVQDAVNKIVVPKASPKNQEYFKGGIRVLVSTINESIANTIEQKEGEG